MKRCLFRILWWPSSLGIQCCHCSVLSHCCGAGLIPCLGTSACCGNGKKKKKKSLSKKCSVRYNIQKCTDIFFFFFFLLRAEPVAYGRFQARGPVGAEAAGLHHSHSNSGSSLVCSLHCSSRQLQILNPLSKARDQPQILMDTS